MNPEEEKKINEDNSLAKKIGSDNLVKLIVAGLGILFAVYMIFSGSKTSGDKTDGCNVNTQSPFGQTPSAMWVELPNYAQTKAIAEFDFTYPEVKLADYAEEHFRAYRKQVFEVYYTNSEGKEGIRFSKAYTCNGLEVYPPDDGTFRSTVIEDIDGMDVKEYGDGENISLMFWVKGDYSYTILALNNPLPKAEMEALISQTE